MPKFKVGGSFGFAGTNWEQTIEAEDEEQALEYAGDYMRERIYYWAELAEEEGDDTND